MTGCVRDYRAVLAAFAVFMAASGSASGADKLTLKTTLEHQFGVVDVTIGQPDKGDDHRDWMGMSATNPFLTLRQAITPSGGSTIYLRGEGDGRELGGRTADGAALRLGVNVDLGSRWTANVDVSAGFSVDLIGAEADGVNLVDPLVGAGFNYKF